MKNQAIAFFKSIGATCCYDGKTKTMYLTGITQEFSEQAIRNKCGRHSVFNFPFFIVYL